MPLPKFPDISPNLKKNPLEYDVSLGIKGKMKNTKKYIARQHRKAEPPAGPDNNIRGDTVGRSEAYFVNLLHFK